MYGKKEVDSNENIAEAAKEPDQVVICVYATCYVQSGHKLIRYVRLKNFQGLLHINIFAVKLLV